MSGKTGSCCAFARNSQYQTPQWWDKKFQKRAPIGRSFVWNSLKFVYVHGFDQMMVKTGIWPYHHRRIADIEEDILSYLETSKRQDKGNKKRQGFLILKRLRDGIFQLGIDLDHWLK